MLPLISSRNVQVIECLEKAGIEVVDADSAIEFEISCLFDSIWIWCVSRGMDLPNDSEWNKDFSEFCIQLMEPWSLEAFNSVGLDIRLKNKSNVKARYRYEISNR